MSRPVTVYAEMTPNPATMKFVADVMLVKDGNSVEFLSKAEIDNNKRRRSQYNSFRGNYDNLVPT